MVEKHYFYLLFTVHTQTFYLRYFWGVIIGSNVTKQGLLLLYSRFSCHSLSPT
jgi:hypothetical protein